MVPTRASELPQAPWKRFDRPGTALDKDTVPAEVPLQRCWEFGSGRRTTTVLLWLETGGSLGW